MTIIIIPMLLVLGISRFVIKVLEPSLQGSRRIFLLGGSRETVPPAVLRATRRGCWRQ